MNSFSTKKIPICNNVEEVKEFLETHKDSKFCLYLAYKKSEDWDKSTSRVYMNQINDKLVYLPVNIEKDDLKSIEEIYKLSEENQQIVAINQTQPHKSNLVLKKWFANQDIPQNVDSLIKDKDGRLQLFDLNGPSFAGWFKDEVSEFENKQVIILGVGGVGEPIARKVIEDKPSKLYLVDKFSKEKLCEELSNKGIAKYFSSLNQISLNKNDIIFINCAGKEGVDDSSAINLLEKFKHKGNLFIDLRPHLHIDIVNKAKELGWNSYTGHGMNARNDYSLLTKICELIDIIPPSFEEFKELVVKAS